ncbi:MAG: metal ABC transporter permease [Eubacteriales bacterium]
MNIIDTLLYYFSFSFVVYAMIVGVLVALCSSLLGATLVLKRFSYIGDGLSHIAFGSIAIASVLDIADQNLLAFPVTALCAVLLLRLGQNAKVNGDAAIAMLSVGSLAVGYLLLNIFSVSSNVAGDVCTTLFGSTSILTLTETDVITCIVLSIVVIIIFIVFYNKIFSVTFDETFARATGINVALYNLLIAIVIAAVIVIAMNLVGSLLVSALVVFPALSSMRLFHHFRTVIISSVVVSVLCAFTGILLSIIYGTPVGSTIVTANIIVFSIAYLIEKLRS